MDQIGKDIKKLKVDRERYDHYITEKERIFTWWENLAGSIINEGTDVVSTALVTRKLLETDLGYLYWAELGVFGFNAALRIGIELVALCKGKDVHFTVQSWPRVVFGVLWAALEPVSGHALFESGLKERDGGDDMNPNPMADPEYYTAKNEFDTEKVKALAFQRMELSVALCENLPEFIISLLVIFLPSEANGGESGSGSGLDGCPPDDAGLTAADYALVVFSTMLSIWYSIKCIVGFYHFKKLTAETPAGIGCCFPRIKIFEQGIEVELLDDQPATCFCRPSSRSPTRSDANVAARLKAKEAPEKEAREHANVLKAALSVAELKKLLKLAEARAPHAEDEITGFD